MPRKGEEYESAQFEIDVADDTGKPFWRGAGAGDKEETVMDEGEPLTLDPAHFPLGTRVVIIEPWDEEFYDRLFADREKVCEQAAAADVGTTGVVRDV